MEDLSRARIQLEKEIREAIVFLRDNNSTIPSETIEFMKQSSLKALEDTKPKLKNVKVDIGKLIGDNFDDSLERNFFAYLTSIDLLWSTVGLNLALIELIPLKSNDFLKIGKVFERYPEIKEINM